MNRPIIIERITPSLPFANSNFMVYFDGTHEGGSRGWGNSEDAALEDFLEQITSHLFLYR